VEDLRQKAREHRRTLVDLTQRTGGAYLAQALSCIDLMTALMHRFVRGRPEEPGWDGRDRFLLSPGHYALPLYVCLADRGYFPVEELETFKQNGSRVELATHRGSLPGIEVSGGSLGQALSVGVGMALAGKMRGQDHRVFVMMGDGEQAAGQVWEAAAAAAQFKLGNLVAVVDRNGMQVDGRTKDVMDMEPLVERYRTSWWVAEEVDGHDMDAVVKTMETLLGIEGDVPRVLIGRTVRGKGIPFMESNPRFHYTRLDEETAGRARAELEGSWDDA
jgi:transketolase